MVSWQAKVEIAQARVRRKKRFYASPEAMRRQLPGHQDAARTRPRRSVVRNLDIKRTEVDGHPSYTLTPPDGPTTDLHIFHLHGGGFVEQPEPHHWHFAHRMVRTLGCSYTLPMYPLAPDHDHRTIIATAITAYEQATANTPTEAQVLLGDSAGGSLAITITQDLRTRGHPPPAAIGLFSPWLNLATDSPQSARIDPSDPELGVPGLQQAGRWYAADRELHDPEISPAHDDLTGLPPLSMFIGTRDVLLPDSETFHRHARDAGLTADLHVYPGMFHNWMMKNIPEAHTATNEIIDFIHHNTMKGFS